MSLPPNCLAVVCVLVLLQAVPAFSQGRRKEEKQTAGGGLRIEVTARESGQPIAEAEVFVRHVPERDAGGKKILANVKTDANGIAQLSGIPAGKIFVQVSAKGCKSFSRWYEHAGGGQTIQIQLEKLPRWEGKPRGAS
jgi:hypothetical protein